MRLTRGRGRRPGFRLSRIPGGSTRDCYNELLIIRRDKDIGPGQIVGEDNIQ